jgi:hypothetical protein
MTLTSPARRRRARGVAVVAGAALALTLSPVAAQASGAADPRDNLSPGLFDAGTASLGMDLLSTQPKPAPVTGTNSDLAFQGDLVFSANYSGVNIYDVRDPSAPDLVTQIVCPGSQNDVSVYGDLLFLSVEATTSKIDCTTGGVTAANRFRGVRIFDISDITAPEQVGYVQTCRGSHTHTLVTEPGVTDRVWIYNSGTAGVRPATELAGCENAPLTQAPVTTGNPTQWRIDVIEVPLADPAAAAVVNQPRIFADPETGAFNGLNNTLPNTPPASTHPSGVAYSPLPNTNTCHDITAYPEIGLAAGACQGNGILLDISDPVNPERIDAVADRNFSYWHSATFNNDGTKVVFTDEWGGGGAARCTAADRPEWGANALFDIEETADGTKLVFASYYKIPTNQTTRENCVAHNGSIVPVPGRDIMVQAWYQGGTSVFDFTDTANPKEIAYFDRGPISATTNASGGFWSTYWFNGNVYGNELTRGFDSFALTTTEDLNAVELAAADQVVEDEVNVQKQERVTWPATFTTVRAWQSAVERQGLLSDELSDRFTATVDRAERFSTGPQAGPAKANSVRDLRRLATLVGGSDVEAGLADAILELADTL